MKCKVCERKEKSFKKLSKGIDDFIENVFNGLLMLGSYGMMVFAVIVLLKRPSLITMGMAFITLLWSVQSSKYYVDSFK